MSILFSRHSTGELYGMHSWTESPPTLFANSFRFIVWFTSLHESARTKIRK